MDLFTYLMAKNDHNTSVNKDLFSYLLGKGQSGTYQTYTGTSLSINNTKKGKMKVNLLGNTSQTGEPTPDAPIPVNVVTGDNTITTTGKNLANINVIDSLDVPAFKRIVANDTITVWDNTNASGFMTTERKLSQICPSLKVGDTVTLTYTTTWSSNYIYLDGYNQVWNNGSTKTITQEMLDSTVILYGGYNATTTISNFMFRYSTADSTYEPYQSTSYPIHLGDIELCKIGTYQDRFFKNIPNTTDYNSDLEDNEWYLEKKIEKLTYTGANEEDWNILSGTNKFFTNLNRNLASYNSMFSNYYSYISAGQASLNNGEFTNIGGAGTYLWFRNDDYSNVSNFRTWLSTHNTNVYLPYATPQYIQITGTLKDELEAVWRANSYNGQTNISQVNDDLAFELDVEVKVGN